MFGGFVDSDDAPYSIYLKMQKYLFILGQPHLKVQVGIQRLVLRAPQNAELPKSSRTLCQPVSQVQKCILVRYNEDLTLSLCIRSQTQPVTAFKFCWLSQTSSISLAMSTVQQSPLWLPTALAQGGLGCLEGKFTRDTARGATPDEIPDIDERASSSDVPTSKKR